MRIVQEVSPILPEVHSIQIRKLSNFFTKHRGLDVILFRTLDKDSFQGHERELVNDNRLKAELFRFGQNHNMRLQQVIQHLSDSFLLDLFQNDEQYPNQKVVGRPINSVSH